MEVQATRRLKVVHVITALSTGGAERQVELLVNRSIHESATIALYTDGPVADAMRRGGHHVEVLRMGGWRKILAPFALALRLRRHRPDVVHVHLLAAQLWGIPAARLAGVPVVVSTEHSLMDDTIEGRPHSWWLRLVYRALERLTTRTVAVSATTAKRLARWGIDGRRVSVADNGIDFDALGFDKASRARVRAELGIADGVTVVGAVGRLDPVKRMDAVLRAVAPLLREGAVLVVAGTGPLGEELRAQAARLGTAGSVRWLGARDDIGAVMSAMDVLVSASADETFGMAVVEALGNGLPVVYVECPALAELPVRLPQATQVPPVPTGAEHPRALADALARVVAAARSLPANRVAPALLLDRYGAQAAAARVDDIYRELMQERHG